MTSIKNKPRIMIAGAGSIGFFIGGLLHHAGHQTGFLARSKMVENIQNHGSLTLTDLDGFKLDINPGELDLFTSPDCLTRYDIILVTVKSAATHEMAQLISKYAKSTTTIISLQNGLTNHKTLKKTLPNHQVLAGMVPFNIAQMDGARFHRGTSGNIIIEASPENLHRQLTSPNMPFEAADDMASIQSGKLLLNLNNALNALSGLPLLEQLHNREWRKLMASQIDEALGVMNRSSMKPKPPSPVPAKLIPHILRLPTPLFKIIAKRMLTIDPLARSSMWEDLQKGRKTEIDEFQGEIVRMANELGTSALVNASILAKIKTAEALEKGSPKLNPEDI